MRLKMFATMLLLVPLMGCAGMMPTSTTKASPYEVTQEVAAVKDSAWDGFCAVAEPIPWMGTMPDPIIRKIKAHNHLGALHCGWPE